MRSVLTTAAVLIVIVTPALAQSFDPDAGTGNIVPQWPTKAVHAPMHRRLTITRRDMSAHIHLAGCIIPRIALGTIRR